MSIEIREIDGRQWKYCTSCHTYHGSQRCQWCGKAYKTPRGLAAHERICYLNPKRGPCPVCGGHGGKFHPIYDEITFAQVDGKWVDCPACAEMDRRRDLHWWAKYGGEVPGEQRKYTCAEAQAKLAEGARW